MSSTNMDYKMLENSLYHGAVISGLTIAYSALSKAIFKTTPVKLDFNVKDVGMLIVDISLATYTKDLLIKKGIIPNNIIT